MSNFGFCVNGTCTCGREWMASSSAGLLAELRAHGDETEVTLILWHDSTGHCGRCGAPLDLLEPPREDGFDDYGELRQHSFGED